MTIHIAMAFDDAFAGPSAATISSVLQHTTETVRFHVFHIGLTERIRQNLDRVVARHPHGTIRFHSLEAASLAELHVSGHISALSYARLVIPKLMEGACDRLLYLDGDVIARKSLSPLWQTDIAGHPFAAVENPPIHDDALRLHLPAGTPVYNAGVLLMNIAAWNAGDLSDRMVAYARQKASRLRFHDQDVLNALCAREVKPLPRRWNLQRATFAHPPARLGIGWSEYGRLISDPAIVHYTTASKPWHESDRHPWKHLFGENLRRSGWSDGVGGSPGRGGRDGMVGSIVRRAPIVYAGYRALPAPLRTAFWRLSRIARPRRRSADF